MSAGDEGPIEGDGPRVRVTYESYAKTIFEVPAGKQGGAPVTVRLNRKGQWGCLGGCYPGNDCPHVREARAYFLASGAEPAVLPATPVPTEGFRR